MPTYFNGYDAMKAHATTYVGNSNTAIASAAGACGTASTDYEAAFATDEATITAARGTRDGAIEAAKSTYDTALVSARDQYKTATGTLPSAGKAKIVKAKYSLLRKVVQQQAVIGFN